MHRFERPDEDDRSVEFHLGCGDWIRLLHASGLEVEALIELRAPAGAADPAGLPVTAEWARRRPTEEIWKARKRSPSCTKGLATRAASGKEACVAVQLHKPPVQARPSGSALSRRGR